MTDRNALAVRLSHMSKWFTDQSYEATTLREAVAALRQPPSAPSPRPSEPVADFEQVFRDACDEAGCAYDNEALLEAIAKLRAPPSPSSG